MMNSLFVSRLEEVPQTRPPQFHGGIPTPATVGRVGAEDLVQAAWPGFVCSQPGPGTSRTAWKAPHTGCETQTLGWESQVRRVRRSIGRNRV